MVIFALHSHSNDVHQFCGVSVHYIIIMGASKSRNETKRETKRNETEAAPTIIANLRILARSCDRTATSGSFVSSSIVNLVRLYIVVYMLLLL